MQDEAIGERVSQLLGDLERRLSITALYAVESGSRAWGFASLDSDYDIRFIYVHRPRWYLSVFDQRDTIEGAGAGLLDSGGWELRKALRLFSKCNLALNEWLTSPMVYRQIPGFHADLAALIPEFFNPIGALHHYASMARTAYSTAEPDGRITLKKLFYTLRALMACRWIARSERQPPMEFVRLLDAVSEDSEREWILALLDRKSRATEGEVVTLDRAHREAIDRELAEIAGRQLPQAKTAKHNPERLDTILHHWVLRGG